MALTALRQGRTGDSPLAALTLLECAPLWQAKAEEWCFPCGLSIAKPLAVENVSFEMRKLFANTHERHHQEDHKANPWHIVERVRRTPRSVTVEVYCSCEDTPTEALTSGALWGIPPLA